MPKAKLRRELDRLTDDQAIDLLHDWRFWARQQQLAPNGAWRTWLVIGGRGFGKTRTGAEWVREEVEQNRCLRIALVSETAADARDVMVEGESGILAISHPRFRPKYEPSKRRLTWPNGAIATTYSAAEYEQLRGPQHDGAWGDEIGKWRYPQEALDNLMLGLRLGRNPRCVLTTTPRPTKAIKALLADADTGAGEVVVSHGTTYQNIANLARAFVKQIIKKYEGTRLGRQELKAELLEDIEGALWRWSLLEEHRRRQAPRLTRVVVAIDPSASSKPGAAECGIVVGGLGDDGDGYVLEDLSGVLSPDAWGRRAVQAFDTHQADRIIGETNNGGEMVESVVRTAAEALFREGKRASAHVSYKAVHASRGKRVRAEPVAALYEQGRVHHIGTLPELEDQLCSWEPNSGAESPDRLDANVYTLTELMLEGPRPVGGRDKLRGKTLPKHLRKSAA